VLQLPVRRRRPSGGRALRDDGCLAPLVGIIGTFQALEAIKILAGIGETLAGRLMLFDALASRWHEVRLARDPHCRVCGEARVEVEERCVT